MPDTQSIVEHALRATGALKHGHFLLSSGRHSDRYIEKFGLLRRPGETSLVCTEIVSQVAADGIDVVVGPTTGGVILAFEVARQLGAAAAYAERRDGEQPGREFRRGTAFNPGARVLIVDDILTTGGSVHETLDALQSHGVDVVRIAVLVDRSAGGVDFGMPYFALATFRIPSWKQAECPLCASDVPLIKPGTTPAGIVSSRGKHHDQLLWLASAIL